MGNPVGSPHRSTPPARRHVIQPGWGFPRALIAHVANEAELAGVKPSRWARVALELADPATVAARLAGQDAEQAGSKGARTIDRQSTREG